MLRRAEGATVDEVARATGWHWPVAPPPRNQWFVDSPLEGTGFELPVRGCDESGFRSFCVSRQRERDRKFVDSPLEEAGFELFVPQGISASPS